MQFFARGAGGAGAGNLKGYDRGFWLKTIFSMIICIKNLKNWQNKGNISNFYKENNENLPKILGKMQFFARCAGGEGAGNLKGNEMMGNFDKKLFFQWKICIKNLKNWQNKGKNEQKILTLFLILTSKLLK